MKSALTELKMAQLNCQLVAREIKHQEARRVMRLDDAIKGISEAIKLIEEARNEA